ncbi:hypothetical protein [Tsukamurella paurometabola]|uniref:Head-to-tail stopper n=1 Tax=Tsukamurella paurometabola TaxID=2061 RepID=A0ABS5NI50_TSUPA|nr:hypothetical protein [Tsukamurella paurometabola]MBS4103970.1 hypothetical protein [Tsukamurella paurometabola]
MSLLNRGRETVTVYPEVATVDQDGNTVLRPSAVGVIYRAAIQPMTSTEDTANAESASAVAGELTVSRHRMRLVGYPGVLGAKSQIEWDGKRYAMFGEARVYNGSSRTGHVDYVIVRR